MAADTLDLITYAEGLDAIQQDSLADSDDEAALERIITGVSRQVDRDWGPMVARSVTALHDGGHPIVFLEQYPVSSITTVYERTGTTQTTITAENYASPTANDYLLDAATGRLWRRSVGGDYCWATGRRNITVTYSAGRYASTSAVDSHVKLAAKIAVRHVWAMEKGLGSPTFGSMGQELSTGWPAPFTIPRASAALLGPTQKRGLFA